MDTIVDTAVGQLEKTSQKHEKKIVIDLAVDRIVQFISFYVIGLVTIAIIIFAVIGRSYFCFRKIFALESLFISFVERSFKANCTNGDYPKIILLWG